MANAGDSPIPDVGGLSSSTERSMLRSIEHALFTPRRLSMEELSAVEDSPLGLPQQGEQVVPQQQAMVQRNYRRQELPRESNGDSSTNGRSRQHSRTPRLPSSDQRSDDLSLVTRRGAQPGGNRDTFLGGAQNGRASAGFERWNISRNQTAN